MMREQTFHDWLLREISTRRMALVGIYESRDKLLYLEAPALRKKYMDIIGTYEESVLQKELEISLLQRKIEMIQISINRREPIDLEAIESALEKERQNKLENLENADITLNELPQLSEQQAYTLQKQYREITSTFHPAISANITGTQRELYGKAVEAYKMQDYEAMKIIYDMLFPPVDMNGISISIQGVTTVSEDSVEEYRSLASQLSTDYRLAQKLYPLFEAIEEDYIFLDYLKQYENQQKKLETEIANIRSSFPFNAKSTMDDPQKTAEYIAELRLRAKHADEDKVKLEQKIAAMTEGI